MQGYQAQLPAAILQEGQASDDQAIKKVDGLETNIKAPHSDIPQPGPEQSPLCQPSPQPQWEPSPLFLFDDSVESTHVGESAEFTMTPPHSEPASEPSVATHKTIPEALFKTNLASLRFRKSPYFEATLRWGAQSFQPYNHVLMPQVFTSVEDECENLRNNVCLWDVTCEQQIEIVGEDALQLAELLTPRFLGSMKVGEARYSVMTDEEGMVINDPIVLKIAEDRYWFSIADQDMLWWIKGLALGRALNVKVTQLDVSPLAVQGPKSLPLMKDLFGDWVEDLKPFNFREVELDGIPMVVCRSGWSPERGYELFLQDCSRGDELWEKCMAAGQKYSIKPGRPNMIRRLEGGMLSFGIDMSPKNNVLELPLPPKWCGPDKAPDFLGKAAIKCLMESGGPKKRIVGLELEACDVENRNVGPMMDFWDVLAADEMGNDTVVGKVTSLCFSPAIAAHIAIATVTIEMSTTGTNLRVDTAFGGCRSAIVKKLPFMPRAG